MINLSFLVPQPMSQLAHRVAAVREFSRVYRSFVASGDPEIEDAEMGPLECQAFLALGAAPDGMSGPQMAEKMRLHKSQVSRFVESFRLRGYIASEPAPWDRRIRLHKLTRNGKAAHRSISTLAHEGIVHALHRMPEGRQVQLVEALATAARLLESREPWLPVPNLRDARAGDFGWVVERHGTLYNLEHGYDETFEAFVARGIADFVASRDPRKERAFIAEIMGARAGSAFVVRENAEVARLRFVLVDPPARGFGVGRRLLEEAIRFATSAGYRRMVLWTQAHLEPAIRLYKGRGFRKVKEEPHPGFGRPVRAQEWALDLKAPAK
jgi:GNAT superfamily N-acetyltransferase/DNA-binding MarR family transcriptional regulator